MKNKSRKYKRKSHLYFDGSQLLQSSTPNFGSMVNNNPAAGLNMQSFGNLGKSGGNFLSGLSQYGGAVMGGVSGATGLVTGVMGALQTPDVQQIVANGIDYGISNKLYTDYSKDAKAKKNQMIQQATSKYFDNFTSGLEGLNEMTIDMDSAKDSIKASNFSGNSTTDLMNQWNNTDMYNVNDYMNYYDELDEQRADYQNSIYDSRLDYLNGMEYQDETSSLGKYGVGKALGNVGSMAASGATLGSVIPGIGTVIGGVAGAIGGAISSIFGARKRRKKEKERQRVEDYKEDIYNQERDSSIDELTAMQQATADLRADQRANTLNTFTGLTENANRQTTLNFNNAADNANRNNIYNLLASTYADGGKLNNNFTNGVTTINNGGTHEENKYEGVQMGIAPDGIPNLVEEGEVIFNDYVYSNRLSPNKDMRKKNKYKGKSFADIAKYISKESEERPNDPISKRGLEEGLMRLANNQELIRQEKEDNKTRKYAKGGKLGRLYEGEGTGTNWLYKPFGTPSESDILGMLSKYENTIPVTMSTRQMLANDLINKISEDKKSNKTNKTNKTNYLSHLRYAPALGSGIGALMASFSDPDYYNADLIGNVDLTEGIDFNSLSPSDYAKYLTQTKAKADTIGAETIGDYLSYDPLDTQYTLNKMNQQAAATRRAIMNTSGGNSAAARASLLAADYNAQNAVGEALRQDAQYNQAMKERVAAFNRGTNQYNADAVIRAAMANQQAKNSIELANAQMEAQRKQALAEVAYKADNVELNKAKMQASINQAKLQQAYQQAIMRNQIETLYNQNKSNAWSNFLGDLGNIGTEAVQQGWMDRLIDSGALKFDKGGLLTKPKRKRRK